MYIDSINKILNRKHANFLFCFMGIMSMLVYLYLLRFSPLSTINYTMLNLSFAFSIIVIIGLVNMIGYFSKAIGFIGFISYELYLLEAALMWKYMIIRQLQSYNVWLFLVVYFISIFLLGYLLNRVISKITNKERR